MSELADSDLVIEFVEILHGLRQYKVWHEEHPLPIRKNALVLLMFLHHHLPPGSPGIQPSELGEMLSLTRPAVTTLVNSLEEHHLVERINDAEDRRVVFVRPTEEGLALVRQAKEGFANNVAEIMDYLGPEDGKELVRITRRVRKFLHERQNALNGGTTKCGD